MPNIEKYCVRNKVGGGKHAAPPLKLLLIWIKMKICAEVNLMKCYPKVQGMVENKEEVGQLFRIG